MSRVKVIKNSGICQEECLMEFLEKEELLMDKLVAELETANVRYSAVLTVWMQQPEVKRLRADIYNNKKALHEHVLSIFKRLELDPKEYKYNVREKQIEKVTVN